MSILLISRSTEGASLCARAVCKDSDQRNPASNPVGLPDLYFGTGPPELQLLLLTGLIALFALYQLLFRAPITGRV